MMTLLAFIFRLILFLLIFRFAGIVLRALFGGLVRGFRPRPQPGGRGGSAFEPAVRGQVEELVQDPVCGVHTSRSSAIAGRYKGAPAFFCSAECAEKASTHV